AVQSVRQKDENSRKQLAKTYLQVVELLMSVSIKKTDVVQEIQNDGTEQNIGKILEKFREIDTLCQGCITHCSRPTSQHLVTEAAQNLQEALDQVKLSQSGLSLTSEEKEKQA
ncbi:unnamed protein product, partial [Didymodactylos carnosus]